ncbi:alpha/beta hydrolase [Thermodesulfobacteriota bacterium]
MVDVNKINYAHLDRPEILGYLFHPRSDWGPQHENDITIPVEENVSIGARFHLAESLAPAILFFHGNGEIVADYDELGPVYTRLGIHFLAVDYRGYGRSTGTPSITAMMQDCHTIFHFCHSWLKGNGYRGRLFLMGRSLGSASVIELASSYPEMVDGLIVESGFAYTDPLLNLLGIDTRSLGLTESDGLNNLEKIHNFSKPTLIIHAEKDHIIPFSDGQALYDACTSSSKTMLEIPGANHNDIFALGFEQYLEAVKQIVSA